MPINSIISVDPISPYNSSLRFSISGCLSPNDKYSNILLVNWFDNNSKL